MVSSSNTIHLITQHNINQKTRWGMTVRDQLKVHITKLASAYFYWIITIYGCSGLSHL